MHLKEWKNHVQFLWFRYVLGFDARDQVKAIRKTKRGIQGSVNTIKNSLFWKNLKQNWKWWVIYLSSGLCLFLTLWLLIRKRELFGSWWRQLRQKWFLFFVWYHKKKVKQAIEGKDKDSKGVI